MTETKKAAPKPPEVQVRVIGRHAIDGVAPGGLLDPDMDTARLRYLVNAGHVSVTVGSKKITDGAIVARIEGA
jgi:hypothetical protein